MPRTARIRARSRRLQRALAALALAGAATLAAGADPARDVAAELARRFPPASIHSRAVAEQALAAAAQADRDAQGLYEAEHAGCVRAFLATRCFDAARRRQILAQREVLRVQVEAHDWERADDAAQRSADALAQSQRQAADRAAHAEHARQALPGAAPPAGVSGVRPSGALPVPQDPAANRARFEQNRAAHADERARANSPEEAARRQDNAREFAARRQDAAAHADDVEADRKAKEAQREERRKKMADDEQRRMNPPPAEN